VIGSNSIFTFPRLGQKVQQTSIPLSYTPRKLLTSPYSRLLYTVESDHRTFGLPAMEKMVGDLQAAEMEVDEEMLQLDQAEFGLPRAPSGTWGSCLRIVDPVAVSRLLSLSIVTQSKADHFRRHTGGNYLQTRFDSKRSCILSCHRHFPLYTKRDLPRRRNWSRYFTRTEIVQTGMVEYLSSDGRRKESRVTAQD